MAQKLVPRWAILLLIAGLLIFPIAICVILGVASLLVAMGDSSGGTALKYIAWGCGILWVIDLVCLVLAQGLNTLAGEDRGE
jgi:hypothetical protein